MFGQIVSIIVKTLRNTNLVALRCCKMKETSLSVDVRRSKTHLLIKAANYPFLSPLVTHRVLFLSSVIFRSYSLGQKVLKI